MEISSNFHLPNSKITKHRTNLSKSTVISSLKDPSVSFNIEKLRIGILIIRNVINDSQSIFENIPEYFYLSLLQPYIKSKNSIQRHLFRWEKGLKKIMPILREDASRMMAFRAFLQLLHKRSGWKYEISCKLLITSGYCTRNTLARKQGELFGAWPWRNRVTRAAET